MKFILVSSDRQQFIGPFDTRAEALSHMLQLEMLAYYVAIIWPPGKEG